MKDVEGVGEFGGQRTAKGNTYLRCSRHVREYGERLDAREVFNDMHACVHRRAFSTSSVDFFGTVAPLAGARSSVPCLCRLSYPCRASDTPPDPALRSWSHLKDTSSLLLRGSRAPMAFRGLNLPSHLRSHVGSAVSDVRRFSATVMARTPRVSAAAGPHRRLHYRAGAASRSLVVHVVANELNKWYVSHVDLASAVASGRRHERSCTLS